MKAAIIAIILASSQDVVAQRFLINEVRPSQSLGSDMAPGWVELFNASDLPLSPDGWSLVLNGRVVRIDGVGDVAPGAFALLPMDASEQAPTARIPVKGAAVLVAPDGTTVADLFTWPELPAGASYGRCPDGSTQHGFLLEPSPGVGTGKGPVIAERVLPPDRELLEDGRSREVDDGTVLRYTTDGSAPDEAAPEWSSGIKPSPEAPLRIRAFAEGRLPSADRVWVAPGREVTIVMDPKDLWDPRVGVHLPGMRDNHSRKGRSWQRTAWVGGLGGEVPVPCRLSVAGSGSRGLPKKNLKLRAPLDGPSVRFMTGDSLRWTEVTLRADATPHAFLRNTFISEVAELAGGRVDVVHGEALPVRINGRPWGLFRVLPPKDAEWFRHLAGGSEVEVVKGSSDTTNAHHTALRKALIEQVPLAELERWADVRSLVELACLDLWTGRVDHELNVLCWRPATATGRWRWVLYDMDLWASLDDPTVMRMTADSGNETPWLPQLLAHPDLRTLLLTRLVELEATVLAPKRALAHLDQLRARFATEMAADRACWADSMVVVDADEAVQQLAERVERRWPRLMREVGRAVGAPVVNMAVEVQPAGAGVVAIDGVALTYAEERFLAFGGHTLSFSVTAAPGMEFLGWAGDVHEAGGLLTIDPGQVRRVKALFRPVAVSSQHRLKQ